MELKERYSRKNLRTKGNHTAEYYVLNKAKCSVENI
jgi:hypothetical protein